MKEVIDIGLIGCGTVGGGVIELLSRRRAALERSAGRALRVRRIAVRDLERPRPNVAGLVGPEVEWTDDVDRVVGADDLDLVVEVAGGTEEPRDWMVAALRNGKDVVTANKAALAFFGREIFGAAIEAGRRVYYEASVAGGIPIVDMLQNGLVANQITELAGILNGTCNYILTCMDGGGADYSAALALAQEKGFAETDPALDVGGDDAAHKLALLVGILTGTHVPATAIYTEGIERIGAEDIEVAQRFHYRLKLLALAKLGGEGEWELRVHPTLIPEGSILAGVQNENNAVELKGDAVGPMMISGKGAGALPTSSSVVADIVRAARSDGSIALPVNDSPNLVPIERVVSRHYIRLMVLDVPGVLGRITSLFGMRQISISSIHQTEAKMGKVVPVVFMTHAAADEVVSKALKDLEDAELLQQPATRIRIEDGEP
jgi:homoserine dehydrogenase